LSCGLYCFHIWLPDQQLINHFIKRINASLFSRGLSRLFNYYGNALEAPSKPANSAWLLAFCKFCAQGFQFGDGLGIRVTFNLDGLSTLL